MFQYVNTTAHLLHTLLRRTFLLFLHHLNTVWSHSIELLSGMFFSRINRVRAGEISLELVEISKDTVDRHQNSHTMVTLSSGRTLPNLSNFFTFWRLEKSWINIFSFDYSSNWMNSLDSKKTWFLNIFFWIFFWCWYAYIYMLIFYILYLLHFSRIYTFFVFCIVQNFPISYNKRCLTCDKIPQPLWDKKMHNQLFFDIMAFYNNLHAFSFIRICMKSNV